MQKAVILAADSKDEIPSCFTATVGFVSLLEHHLRLLKLLGFKNDDICIIVGKGKIWQSLYDKIDPSYKLYKVDNIGKKSFISLQKFLSDKKEFLNADLLLINANTFFELKDFEKLTHATHSSALSFMVHNTNTKSLECLIQNDTIVKISSKKATKIPYFSYFGALKLCQNNISAIKNYKKSPNKAYIDVLINDIKLDIKFIDITWENADSTELVGGSFAGLSKAHLVKKSADTLGNEKLIGEIKWLLALPPHLKSKFPMVLDYKIGKDNSSFLMPFYNLENLRKKIVSGKFSSKESLYFLEKILSFCFENLYETKRQKAPENWVFHKHFERVRQRFEKIKTIAPFDKLLQVSSLVINGKNYENLPQLVDKLYQFEQETHFFQPKELVMIHGDLHFQNMLIDEQKDDFILADPRGDEASDLFYDLGKLWHSCNGLYDLIHTDIALAKITQQNSQNFVFDFIISDDKGILQTYAEIKKKLFDLLESKFLQNNENWLLKTLFAEAMHFASLMYFHLKYDTIENRSLCLYLQAVLLCTELLKILDKRRGGGLSVL